MENVFTYLKNQFVFQLDVLFQVDNPAQKPVLNQQDSNGFIIEFIIENNLTEIDILLLGLAFVPHVKPDFLSAVIAEYLPKDPNGMLFFRKGMSPGNFCLKFFHSSNQF